MNVFLAAYVLLVVSGFIPALRGKDGGYLSRERTINIRGAFTLLIILCHYAGMSLFDIHAPENILFTNVWGFVDQCVVACFLFDTGYGLTVSYRERGPAYGKTVLMKKMPRFYIQYLLAAVMMIYMTWAMGVTMYNGKEVIKVLTAWQGAFTDDQWYVLTQLILYGMAFVCFLPLRFGRGEPKKWLLGCAVLLALGGCALSVVWQRLGKAYYWYNSLPAFVLGVVWAMAREWIEKVIRHPLPWAVLLIACAAGTLLVPMYPDWAIRVPLFMATVLLFSYRVPFGNAVFRFFGQHSLSIYLLMRFPMLLLRETGLALSHPYLSLIPVMAITVCFALAFDHLTGLLWKRLHL